MADAAGDHISIVAGTAISLNSRRYALRSGRSRLQTPLLVLGVAVIGYVVWMSSSKPPRPVDPATENPIAGILAGKQPDQPAAVEKPVTVPPPTPRISESPVPVDLTPPKSRPTVGPSGTHIERSANTVVQWADKTDPSRLAGEFSYASLEPIEAKRYLVQSPRAWIFLKDGWSVLIQSESGRVYIPDEQATKRPESGTLRGKVLIRAYRPRPDSARPNPDTDEAYLIAETDSLVFDGSVGELSTPDRLVARWAQGYFAGRGLTAIYNEIKARVEFAEIREGEELILHPTPKERRIATATTTLSQSGGETAPANNPVGTPATPPVSVTAIAHEETLYRAVFTSDVKITQAQRTLASDQLELWARLVDGKFPADAFGEKTVELPKVPAIATSPAPVSAGVVAPVQAEKVASAPATIDPSQADIRLTWTGPFQIRTSDTPMAELEHDSLSLRFTSARTGIVTASAEDLHATARCSVMDYFASRRQIRMEGQGADGVVIALEKAGTARASNLTADLAKSTARMTGAGVLEGAAAMVSPTPSAVLQLPSVAWSEQAELLFDQSSGRALLKEAIFTGAVNARDRESTITGTLLRAEFIQAAQSTLISRLTVQEHARASGGVAGEISGDHLDATFKPLARDDKSVSPAIETLQARGNVFAKRASDQIQAGFLDVRFVSDPVRSAVVSTVLARDDVRLASTDVRATAAELKVEALTQIIELTGTQAIPATASRGATTITGPALRMDGTARTLAANGPGSLSHAEPAKVAGVADSRINAKWTKSLAFDDRLGTASLNGDVSAIWLADPASADILKSRTLDLVFTPYSDPPPASTGTPAVDAAIPPRELLRATAIGTDSDPASLESRRYNPADTGPLDSRKPERVTYLEGARILADNLKGTLDVPVSGKLLVSDRRPGETAQSSGSFAGDALFRWKTSLNVRRDAETAEMRGGVEVIHLRPGDANATEMRCEEVTATMRRSPHAAGPAAESVNRKNELAMRGEISRILATGSVWARSASKREITADVMDYDAPAGMMLLSGNGGRDITAFDPASGAPIRGRNLEWDLKLDRIRVKDVGGISVPR